MAFQGFTPFQATPSTLSAQLYANESLLASQTDVGLYNGKTRDAAHDHGTLHLTTHRLIYLDAARPEFSSAALNLAEVRQTECWAGFLKSSAKISLSLGGDDDERSAQQTEEEGGPKASADADAAPNAERRTPSVANGPPAASWVCRVCGMSNAPLPQCALCGMPRSASAVASPAPSAAPPEPSTSSSSSPAAAAIIDSGDIRISCPACTFLNHPSLATCEICDSRLDNDSAPTSTRSTTPSVHAPSPKTGFVKLSFRKGGDKVFYAELKKALHAKAWQLNQPQSNGPDRFALAGIGALSLLLGQASASLEAELPALVSLLDGILRTMDTAATERDTSMQTALSDLSALMAQAKSMVDLAQSLNSKLQTTQNSQEATTIKTSLQAMGLDVAVTSDMAASSRDYSKKLAAELAQVLDRRRTLQIRGMVGLDEVWCIWNRARGVSLVSPKEFKDALNYLPSTVHYRLFKSGLAVLHAPHMSQENFTHRLLAELENGPAGGISSLQVAQSEQVGLTLAHDMCQEVEAHGQICRDEQGDGGSTRWWPNVFLQL